LVTVRAPTTEPQTDDFYRRYEFMGALDPHFLSLRVPPDESMLSLSQRPGYLRLYGRESILSRHRQTFLGTQICETCFCATTLMEFEPQIYQQAAGLSLFYHTANLYYLQITWDETAGKCARLFVRDGGKTRLSVPVSLPEGLVLLRAMMRGQAVRFYVKAVGSADWAEIGAECGPLPARILSDEYAFQHGEQGFTGSFLGLCCQDQTGGGLHADFQYLDVARSEG